MNTVYIGRFSPALVFVALCACSSCKAADTTPSADQPAAKANLPPLVLDLGAGVRMQFVAIPAGEFRMGSEDGDKDEKPAHRVRITKPFYMGKYEVTQEQWQALMGKNPSRFKGAKNPVECVSWFDCPKFLEKLAAKAPKGFTCCLPTEAEWEYACRAGTTTKYHFGDDENELADYAWYDKNSDKRTHPVGEKKPNPWGLYDMYGNCWEWCQDLYVNKYPAGDRTDPVVSQPGKVPVLRVGSWFRPADRCRSAHRYKATPQHRNGNLGFRVALRRGTN